MIDLNPNHLVTVQRILAEHVPECEVRAFGSRATWTSKDYSDLDLAVVGEGPLHWRTLGRLKEAFEESRLPMRVDVLDWHAISESFRKVIKRDYVVVQENGDKQTTADEWRETVYGRFANTFSEDSLADLCDKTDGIQTGPFGSQLHQEDYVPAGTPIITVEHLGENRITHHDLPCVSDYDRDRLSKYTLRQGDIVFSRVGSVDRRSLVRGTEEGWLFSGRCLRVRPDPNQIDPAYLSYFFGLPAFREHIRSIAVGATMPSLNTQILSDVTVVYPPLATQRAIAHVLGTLDDKIDLNRRMNETLEEMARALFKSWFMDFEPVRAKMEGRWRRGESLPGLPAEYYDLFPDRLVDSELREIPAGWRVGNLGEVGNQRRSGASPEEIDPTTPYIALEHMPKQCIALSDWGTADGLASNKFRFKRGDILFGKLRPYFHKVGVASLDGVCSTDIVVISPVSKDWFSFLLGHVSSREFVDYTNAGSTGTKMPRTSWPDMARYQIALPDPVVVETFNQRLRPATERMLVATHESRALAAQRDALLPGLVSGEQVMNLTTSRRL